MKVFKKLAAAGAALMMAFTGMAMSASAYSESYLFHYYSSLPSQYNSTTKSWTRTITKTTQTVDVTAFSKPNNSSPYLRYTNSMGSQTDIFNVQTVNCYVPYNALGTTATISVTLMGHTAKPGTYGSEGTVTG